MKRAILLVGHGSRDEQGNEELIQFAERVRAAVHKQYPLVETCFLEFATPTIQQGIQSCIEKGASHVTLVPVILLGAGHSKLHIPHEIDIAKQKHPQVQFAYGKPIGVHEKVLDILESRLQEAGYVTSSDQPRTDEAILLVGRGSSDPDANSDLCKIARLLWERVNVRVVETCFIGVTAPDFAEGMQRCIDLGAKRVYVLPYFLFTGVLIKRISANMHEFSQAYPDVEMKLGGYFGLHDRLVEILQERVEEASQGTVQMNCDLCQYRLGAVEAHHHHHHDHEHEHHHHEEEAQR